MGSNLRIWLLGGFRCEVDGHLVIEEAWRRNRAKAVVKLLAAAPGHRLHREGLMATLWPELDAEAAAANLRKAVHFARQALGHEHLRARSDLLTLEADNLWIDVDAFEEALKAGTLLGALELYAGDLLPEDRFESWTDEPRQRLWLRWQAALGEYAEELEQAGDRSGAVEVLERLAAADALNEQATLGLMRLHALAGRRHLALERYSRLQRRLGEELGVAPGQPLRELHSEIAAGRFPSARAAPAPPPLQAAPQARAADQLKVATVLVADVAALPQAADPERTRHDLEIRLEDVRAVLGRWGAASEHLAGGVLIAVFGVPTAHEDDPARALEAALDLLHATGLPLRVGVSTGGVIAPTRAGASPREVVGEAVTLALRLREAAEPGEVLVAMRTCQAAGPRYSFSDRLQPGPGKPPARRLLGRTAAAAGDAQGLLIGREAEAAAILDLLGDTAGRGRPRLMLVSGPAGVGKSRLAREVIAAAGERHPGLQVLLGRCLPAGWGSTFGALGEILRAACGISLADPPATAARRLAQAAGRLLAGQAEPGRTVCALATTAGIPLADNPLDRAGPESVSAELTQAWPAFFSALAGARPTLVLVEDLHWADEPMLEMVERIITRASGPLMVLVTARPELLETRPALGAATAGFSAISLEPLTEGESLQLLDSLPGARDLAPELRVGVMARAEGNPYFLEELARHLEEGGSGSLPDSLQSLLAARLDRLPPDELRVLQQAAVVGRRFWTAAVERGLPEEQVPALLVRLERRGFVIPRAGSSLPGQPELVFRHALIHDAAHESLPATRRARQHAKTAEWLEEVAGSQGEEIAELLAWHWAAAAAPEVADLAWPDSERRAEVRAQAYEHLLQAGASARARFAIGRAVELHERAVALASTLDGRLLALEELAADHDAAYHGDAARVVYGQAIEAVRADPARGMVHARLCRKLGWMMAFNPGAFRSSPDPAWIQELVAEGLAAAGDRGERAWLELVDAVCARLYRGSEPFGQGARYDSHPIEDRIGAAEGALRTAEELELVDLMTACRQALGVLYGIAGRHDDQVALLRREVAEMDARAPRLERADAFRHLAVGVINVSAGFEEALGLARHSYVLSRDTNPHQVMHATWPLLAALFHLGRWQEVLEVLEEHLAAFGLEPALECQFVRDGPVIGAATLTLMGRKQEAREVVSLVGDPLADRGSASAWQARFAVIAGEPEVARMISEDKALEDRSYAPQHALALVEAHLSLQDWDSLHGRSLPRARSIVGGNALLGPVCDRAEGLMQAAAGDLPGARVCLRRSITRFEELATPYEAARSRSLLSRIVDPPVARRLEAAAAEAYARLGMPSSGRSWDIGSMTTLGV